MIEQIHDADLKKSIARKILEALKDWFEVDESREKYIAESTDQIFLAAKEEDEYGSQFIKSPIVFKNLNFQDFPF